MVKVVNKVKDELEKLPHFTVSYGIKIGSDRESWLELESSNLGQGRESESEYWNKVTRPLPKRQDLPRVSEPLKEIKMKQTNNTFSFYKVCFIFQFSFQNRKEYFVLWKLVSGY